MVEISVEQVRDVFGEQDPSLDPAKQTELANIAERLTENVFDGRVARQPEIEGNKEDFTRYLAAHLWEIAERKRLNNEFQTGFSEDLAGLRTDPESALSGTPYGNMALTYLRGRASIGVIRADW